MLRRMYERESLYKDDLDTSDIIDEEWTKFEAERFQNEECRMKNEELNNEEFRMKNEESDEAVAEGNSSFYIHHSSFKGHSSLRKYAAIFVGVLLLSGITYAAIRFVGGSADGQEAGQEQTVVATDGRQTAEEAPLAQRDSTLTAARVFENQELGAILEEVAQFYDCEVVYKDENARRLRLYFTWDKTLAVDDVVGTFNKFERFHIKREGRRLIVE